jgi:putative ABC transport system permease protein
MRLYRALLRLYPGFFRAEYQDELCRAFAARAAEFHGPLRPIAIVLAALADVVPNAFAAHGDVLRQDLVYAARSLRRMPGFALTAILVVALGVGANTAVFSIADLVFVRPLPFSDPDQLVKLWQGTRGVPGNANQASPANYRDWRTMASSFSGMGAYWSNAANLVGTSEPRRLEALRATPELLPLMGVAPSIGRLFTAEDLAGGQCVVLSHALWKSLFGGDPGVIGTSVRLDGIPHTVTGVMPASFQFPSRTIEAWASLVLNDEAFTDRGDTYLNVVARLRPGVGVERARQELDLVSARLEQQYPKENRDVLITVFTLREELARGARLLVLTLCGAGLCILLLACANLASLFLARGAHRAHELAVRAALGAGRERLVRQLVTESLALAFVGGVLGIAVALAGVPLLQRLVPGTLPIADRASLDPRVLALAGAFMLVTGLVFGLVPALRAARSNALEALRSGVRTAGGGTQRLRAGLVVMEVAASVMLLIGSGLLIRAVWKIQSVDAGFVAENVLTLRTALPLPKYLMTEKRAQYYERVLEQVRPLRGVQSAAFVTGLPMSMRGGIWEVTVPGREFDDQANFASLRYVTPQYFATLGIPLQRGRDVAESDRREQPLVAVVSESFAEQYWPGEDPLGKRFDFVTSERTVVGVVGDIRVRGRLQPSEPQVYLPYAQVRDSSIIGYIPKELVVRTDASMQSGALLPRIREIVRSIDPEQPISNVGTLSEIVAEETAPRVTQLWLLVAFSVIALLIAGLGIHGLLAFTVAKRSQELGVRMALGAQVSGIVGLVLREGLALALIGIAVGGLAAYAAARGMSALLFGVPPEDPLTMAAAVGLCLVTAAIGCLRPAIQAARVDPLCALRAE